MYSISYSEWFVFLTCQLLISVKYHAWPKHRIKLEMFVDGGYGPGYWSWQATQPDDNHGCMMPW